MHKNILFLVPALLCLNFSSYAQKAKIISSPEKAIRIEGTVEGNGQNDTLTLKCWAYFIKVPLPSAQTTVIVKDGRFSFQLPAYNHPIYIELGISRSAAKRSRGMGLPISFSLAEPGDHILMKIDSNDRPVFTGIGADKFTCQQEAATQVSKLFNRPLLYTPGAASLKETLALNRRSLDIQLNVLKAYKNTG